MKALTHYIHKLPGKHEVNFLAAPLVTSRGVWFPPWMKHQQIKGMHTPTLKATDHNVMSDKMTSYIKTSDLVICQYIKPTASTLLNYNKLLELTGRKTTILTTTTFHFHETDPLWLNQSKTNEINNDIMIRSSNLIESFPGKISCKKTDSGWNHPNSFYFLELTRLICDYVGLDFYDSETYHYYLNSGYPFYQNE